MFAYMCMHAGGQRTTSADIPQLLSTFFVDKVSLPWDLPSSLGLMLGSPKNLLVSVSSELGLQVNATTPSFVLM